MIKPYFQTEFGKLYQGDSYEIMKELDLTGYALLTDPEYGENQNLQRAVENSTTPQRVSKGIVLKRKDWPEIDDREPSDIKPFLAFDQAIIWGGQLFQAFTVKVLGYMG